MIEELRRTGIARLGVMPWVGEFTAHLARCPRYPGHVKARPRDGITCNSMQDVMEAPRFLAYAKSLTPIAAEYFGEPAHLWSLNAFYTDEDTPYIGSINGLHRDREASKILCLFMLGHFTPAASAQLFVRNSQDDWVTDKDDAYRWDAVWGDAGTAWLADTTMLHCGLLPRIPRMLAWARWANCIPEAKHTENLPHVA